jgi:hypothetical protein
MLMRIVLICICLFLVSACDKVNPLKPKQKAMGDCLFEAIDFYAKGGNVFKDSGCNVTTNSFNGNCTAGNFFIPVGVSKEQEDKCVTIIAHDIYNNFDRSLTIVIPAKWLTTDRSQMSGLGDEFNSLVSCLESPSQDEQAKNPLMKENEQAKKEHCNEMSLRINDVPGFTLKSNKAPHFSFTAMKREPK